MYCEGLQELRLGRQFTEFSPHGFQDNNDPIEFTLIL